jgi:signal transduction histidine kinase
MPTSDLALTLLLTTLLIFLFVVGIVMTLLISHRRAERSRRQIARLELDYQKELRTIEAEVQEATLTHLASELHDNIGQLLTSMKLQMEKEKLLYPHVEAILEPMSDTLKTTMMQVRLLSHSLSRDFISDGGLLRIIGQEVERLRSLGRISIKFETDGVEPTLSKDARTVAFRLFQEVFSNALRHAAADHIDIVLKGKDAFYLQVRDDGKGFNKEEATQNSAGMGLRNIPRRAALAGLECSLETAPQKGCIFTMISASLPHSIA